jgi:hypothetical protein
MPSLEYAFHRGNYLPAALPVREQRIFLEPGKLASRLSTASKLHFLAVVSFRVAQGVTETLKKCVAIYNSEKVD